MGGIGEAGGVRGRCQILLIDQRAHGRFKTYPTAEAAQGGSDFRHEQVTSPIGRQGQNDGCIGQRPGSRGTVSHEINQAPYSGIQRKMGRAMTAHDLQHLSVQVTHRFRGKAGSCDDGHVAAKGFQAFVLESRDAGGRACEPPTLGSDFRFQIKHRDKLAAAVELVRDVGVNDGSSECLPRLPRSRTQLEPGRPANTGLQRVVAVSSGGGDRAQVEGASWSQVERGGPSQ